MAGDWMDLKARRGDRSFSRTTDPIERSFHGGDITEMERLVEITSDEPPDSLRNRRL